MARDRRPQLRDLEVEIPMGCDRVGLALARGIATAALVFFLTPQGKAQVVDVSGRYQCAQAKVRRAKIEPGHKIVLRYYGKHGLVEMTYERRVAEMGKTALS